MVLIPYFRSLLILNDKTVKQLVFILVIIFFSAGCKGPLASPGKTETKQGLHKVVVDEVIQAGEYTYLNVTEKRKKIWLAVFSLQAAKGDRFYYRGGLLMTDFFSKELNRTFPSVVLLESISREAVPGKNGGINNSNGPVRVKAEKMNISIEPGERCISIAKLIEDKAVISGKTVRLKGKVTRYNPAILGKNWIHIQDGTELNGVFDLTITTDSQLTVGDTVTFEGKIILNKDFGYGYSYDVLMEDGKLIR
jgi:hypothetical protein